MEPFTENIDKLRGNQESLAFWQRRRRFLAVHWNKFPVEELNNLSYCYSSVMVYSCRYSPEIMNRLYDLAMEVASHQQKEGKGNARRPQEIQEKWELAMSEPDTFGKVMLNTGVDLTGEWTENEGEDEDSGDQRQLSVEERGKNYCTVKSTQHNLIDGELKIHTGKATDKSLPFSSKADECLQRYHEENLPRTKSAPLSSTHPISLKLKIEGLANPLKRSIVQQKRSGQQNTGMYEQSLYSRDCKNYKNTLSMNTNSQHQGVTLSKRNHSETVELSHSLQAYQLHSDQSNQKCIVNTASYLNRHCIMERSPDRNLIWHQLIHTGVKEKIQAKQLLGEDGKYKCIDKKPNGAGIAFSQSTGIQNKAESKQPSIPIRASSTIQQADLDRKEKVVTLTTQTTLQKENKSSGKKTCMKKECVDGVMKAPNALTMMDSSFENKNFGEFYTPKRNRSSRVLNDRYSTSQPIVQSRFSPREYVKLNQRGQSKLSAASKPHPKTLESGMYKKGLLPNTDDGHIGSQARAKDMKFKHAKCASKNFVEEVPRKKSYSWENTSKGPHCQGGRMTRVVYPSVKSQVRGKVEHPSKLATGKSSLPTFQTEGYSKSIEVGVQKKQTDQGYCKSLETGVKHLETGAKQRPTDQGHCKSLETGVKCLEIGVKQRHTDTGVKPSQRPDGGKPNRSLLKTFLHNLLQKARN